MSREGRYALAEAGLLVRTFCRRRLLRDGAPLPVFVSGDVLDRQLDVGGCTVLATSYDYFDACHHWVHLLDRNGRLIDQLRMPDEFGYIQDLRVVSGNEIAFGYMGTNDRWHLTVDEEGFRSYSLEALWRRPNRFVLSRRHLIARRIQGPPWQSSEA